MRRNHKRGDVGCKNKGPVHRVKGTDSEPCAQGDGSSWCEWRRCDEGEEGGRRTHHGWGTSGAGWRWCYVLNLLDLQFNRLGLLDQRLVAG